MRRLLENTPGVAQVLDDEGLRRHRLRHARAGDLVAVAEPNAWFTYYYWDDDRRAPDFARTVEIHRKPGYDPCELFFDPALTWPGGRAMLRLVQKKLGFRTLFDVVPLDATLVRGSHGLPAALAEDRPILVGDGPAPSPGSTDSLDLRDVHGLLLRAIVPA